MFLELFDCGSRSWGVTKNDNIDLTFSYRYIAFAWCCTGVAAQPQLGIWPIRRTRDCAADIVGPDGAWTHLTHAGCNGLGQRAAPAGALDSCAIICDGRR